MKKLQFPIQVMKNSMHPLPEISELRAIIAICKEGTITRAAAVLGTTQSTLSYMLERMRQRFSDPLFVRVGNRMEPTPYAVELAEAATRILALMEAELKQLKSFDPLTTTRQFHIVLTETGAIVLLPALLKKLQAHAPHAKLRPLQAGTMDLEAALSSGEVDIAVGNFTALQGHHHLFQQLLFQRNYVCVVRKDHPIIDDAMTLEQFAAVPQVSPATPSAAFKGISRHLESISLQMNIAMKVEHATAIPFIVGSSNFIALMAREVFDIFESTANLRMVELPLDMPYAQIRQYWHPRVNRDPAIAFLRKLIHEVSLP